MQYRSNGVPPMVRPQYNNEGEGPIYGDRQTFGNTPAHPGGPRGQDTIPTWLTPGEFVVNPQATQMFGAEIEAMNEIGKRAHAAQGRPGHIPGRQQDIPAATFQDAGGLWGILNDFGNQGMPAQQAAVPRPMAEVPAAEYHFLGGLVGNLLTNLVSPDEERQRELDAIGQRQQNYAGAETQGNAFGATYNPALHANQAAPQETASVPTMNPHDGRNIPNGDINSLIYGAGSETEGVFEDAIADKAINAAPPGSDIDIENNSSQAKQMRKEDFVQNLGVAIMDDSADIPHPGGDGSPYSTSTPLDERIAHLEGIVAAGNEQQAHAASMELQDLYNEQGNGSEVSGLNDPFGQSFVPTGGADAYARENLENQWAAGTPSQSEAARQQLGQLDNPENYIVPEIENIPGIIPDGSDIKGGEANLSPQIIDPNSTFADLTSGELYELMGANTDDPDLVNAAFAEVQRREAAGEAPVTANDVSIMDQNAVVGGQAERDRQGVEQERKDRYLEGQQAKLDAQAASLQEKINNGKATQKDIDKFEANKAKQAEATAKREAERQAVIDQQDALDNINTEQNEKTEKFDTAKERVTSDVAAKNARANSYNVETGEYSISKDGDNTLTTGTGEIDTDTTNGANNTIVNDAKVFSSLAGTTDDQRAQATTNALKAVDDKGGADNVLNQIPKDVKDDFTNKFSDAFSGVFKDMFGKDFEQVIARGLIMFAGGVITGMSPQQALALAAQDALKVGETVNAEEKDEAAAIADDAKARNKWARDNVGKYSKQSLIDYAKTGNFESLTPIAAGAKIEGFTGKKLWVPGAGAYDVIKTSEGDMVRDKTSGQLVSAGNLIGSGAQPYPETATPEHLRGVVEKKISAKVKLNPEAFAEISIDPTDASNRMVNAALAATDKYPNVNPSKLVNVAEDATSDYLKYIEKNPNAIDNVDPGIFFRNKLQTAEIVGISGLLTGSDPEPIAELFPVVSSKASYAFQADQARPENERLFKNPHQAKQAMWNQLKTSYGKLALNNKKLHTQLEALAATAGTTPFAMFSTRALQKGTDARAWFDTSTK